MYAQKRLMIIDFSINLYVQDSTARSPPVRITTRTREELNIFLFFKISSVFDVFYVFPLDITFEPLKNILGIVFF